MYAKHCTKFFLVCSCLLGCCLLGSAQEGTQRLFDTSIGSGGTVACTNPPRKPADIFLIPSDLKTRADKKSRLIELLRQSLFNEAKAVNGERKEPKIDAKVEEEIKKLATELAKK